MGDARLASFDGSPARPVGAPGPLLQPSATVLVLNGPIARADIRDLGERIRKLLECGEAGPVVCDVGALVYPDAVAVDSLARLQLTALRLGRRVRLRRASVGLQELLALMGLGEVLPCGAGSGLEPRRQAEKREQALRVQEECDPGDSS
jgi:STAS domain